MNVHGVDGENENDERVVAREIPGVVSDALVSKRSGAGGRAIRL